MTDKRKSAHGGKSRVTSQRERIEAEVAACLDEQVAPALAAVHERLTAQGHEARLTRGEGWIELGVVNFNGLDLCYAVHGRVYRQPVVTLGGLTSPEDLKCHGRIAVEFGGRWREYRLWRCRRAAIERAVDRYYQRFLMVSPQG